jgi:hypothetical protein
MNQVATLLRRWPRASAALGFGAAGIALCLLLWGPLIFHAQGVRPFILFIGTPGVSAALAGGALGKWLLDSAQVCRPRSAALRGAIIGSLALLLYAPLFATVYVLTQPPTEHWDIAGLTLLMLFGSAFVIWLRVALIGAAIGWVLYRLTSHDTGQASAWGH